MTKTQEELIQQLVRSVFRLDDLLRECANEIAAPAGQTGARWQVLNEIARGAATVSDIARAKNTSRQGVQRIVNELAEDGIAAAIPNPKHSRYPLIELTDKGLRALASIEQERSRWSARVHSNLSEEIDPSILDLLTQFTHAVEKTISKGKK